jgi:hypothetical protein
MKDLEQFEAFLSTADEDTLSSVEATIKQTRAGRIAARNAALPECPVLVDIAGNRVEVTRERAIELLNAGAHSLAGPDGQ